MDTVSFLSEDYGVFLPHQALICLLNHQKLSTPVVINMGSHWEGNWRGFPAALSTSALLCPPALTLPPAAPTRSEPPAQLAPRMLRMKPPRVSQGDSYLPGKLCAFVVPCIHRYSSLLWNTTMNTSLQTQLALL